MCCRSGSGVAAGRAEVGDRSLVADLDRELVRVALDRMAGIAADAVDRMRTSSAPLPVVLVGGGAVLLPADLDGAGWVHRPDHAGVANAVGSAIAQIGGVVDRIVSIPTGGRDSALDGRRHTSPAVPAGHPSCRISRKGRQMKRSVDRVLTTHTGSFERPKDLSEMLVKHVLHQDYDRELFERRAREAVADIVAKQVEVGVDVVSDGEAAKPGYLEYAGERMKGFGEEEIDASQVFRFHDLDDYPEIVHRIYADTTIKIPVCTGELKYTGFELVQRDIDNFTAALGTTPAVDAFMPAISPGLLAMSAPNKHYRSYEEYVLAVGAAMNAEYKAITDAGFVLQIDSPDLAFGADMETWMWDVAQERGFGWVQQVNIEALNLAMRGIPAEKARMHLCWANYNGPHLNDLPLEQVLIPAFEADVSGYLFEAANPAHAHEWEVFTDLKLPDGKVIVPGVIDSKTDVVERPELVAQRIRNFTRLVGQENVIAGVDCGFGTFVDVLMVNPKIVWHKLRALAEGARRASEGAAAA